MAVAVSWNKERRSTTPDRSSATESERTKGVDRTTKRKEKGKWREREQQQWREGEDTTRASCVGERGKRRDSGFRVTGWSRFTYAVSS